MDGRTVDFLALDPNAVAQIEATQPAKPRIMDLLGVQGAMWASDIAKALGLDLQSVGQTLRRGLGKDFTKVETLGKNIQWGLLAEFSETDSQPL